ncbi:UNVERIFIED_CONTAM: hypothetical protein RMT77_016496 [Armadillidium vulgare]
MSNFDLDEDDMNLSLLNDITAVVCSVEEGSSLNEMDSKQRWTSEELLSSCALLLKGEYIPSSVNTSEFCSDEISLVTTPSDMGGNHSLVTTPSEIGKDYSICTTIAEKLFDDFEKLCFVPNNSSLRDRSSNSSSASSSSLSSSFTSCESIFEELALSEEGMRLHKHEDSPLIYHSCSSLTDLDDLNEAKSEVFLSPTEKPLITPPTPKRVFDGADVNGSDKGGSSPYDSVTGNEKEVFFFNPGDDSQGSVEILSTKCPCPKEVNQICNSRYKNITHESHNEKMQHLPSSPKFFTGDGGLVSGGVIEKTIFPSSLPGLEAGTLSAKELDDVTCDLFCLPFEEDKITSSSSLCHYYLSKSSSDGEEKRENENERTIKELCPSLSEVCVKVCDNWPTNIITTVSTSKQRTKIITTDSLSLISEILAIGSENTETSSTAPTTKTTTTTTTICGETSADVGESYCGFCDYFSYLYFRNYKYFNRDKIICANKKIPTSVVDMFIEERKRKDDECKPHHAVVISESDGNMFINNHLPKMFFPNAVGDCNSKCCNDDKSKSDNFSHLRGETRSSLPGESVLTPDYVQCKRLSNLFHAVPVLLEYPDYDPANQECSGETLLMGSRNANECYSSDHHALINCDINDTVNGRFTTIKSNNGHDRKTNLASNMKSNQCQFFLGSGTVSGSAVSDDFGAVAKHLDVIQIQECGEYNDGLFIGEIAFSVYGKILSYPIFIDPVENVNESKDFPFVPEDTHFSLATGGHDWNLYLDKNELRPVVQVLEGIMADNTSDDNKDKSCTQQVSTCRLFGFTVSPNKNSKVKSLIPLFNQKPEPKGTVPCRRSSISTSVPLRRSASFANKNHRFSAACDVEMYRNAHEFLPLKEKTGFDSISGDSNFKVHSVVINNPVIDNTPSTISAQHNVLIDESEPLSDIKSKEVISSDKLKPPCVLRSKSDSKIISELNNKRETCRSISLNTSEAECPSNLSRFKGITLVEDQELSTSEIEAKAFLSSFLERSMNSVEKADRNKSSVLNYEHENALLPNTKNSNNLNIAMAGSRILSHISNAEEILNKDTTIKTTVSGDDHHPSELLLTSDVQYGHKLLLPSSLPVTSVSELNPSRRDPSLRDYSNNINYNPIILTPSTTSLTYTTSGVIFSASSPLPCTSASLISSCSVTNVTPLMTKMSVLPMVKETPFSKAPSFEHSVSSSIENSENQYSKCQIGEKNIEKSNCLPTKVSRSSSLKSKVGSIVTQQETPSPPPLPTKISRSLSLKCKVGNTVMQQGTTSPPTPPTKVSRSSSLKNKMGNTVMQRGTPSPPPRRLSYSTKFPMDVICQGRLEEVKRKTAPPGEYSHFTDTRSSIWGSRKHSVGQVKPMKENYPTSRSKSAGRMDFGRTTSYRMTSPENVDAVEEDRKNLVEESHTIFQSVCESPNAPTSYSNEYETININSIPKHRLSEVIKEEPEGDSFQETNISYLSHPRQETNLVSELSNRSQGLRNNNLLLSYIDNLVISLVNVKTLFPLIHESYQKTKSICVPEIQHLGKTVKGKNCSQSPIQSAFWEGPTSTLSHSSTQDTRQNIPKHSSFDEESKVRVESVSETHEVRKSPGKSLHNIISPENIFDNDSLVDLKINQLSEVVHGKALESSKNFKTSDSPVRFFEANESLPESELPEAIIESTCQNVTSTNSSARLTKKFSRESESPEFFYSTSETPFKPNQEESLERFRKSSESPDKFYSIIESLEEPLISRSTQEAQENSDSDKFHPKSFSLKEYMEGLEKDQTESFSNVASTYTVAENMPEKASDHYINNIQIPQLKSKSPDTEFDKAPDNIASTSKCTLGGIVKDVFIDRLFTSEKITKSPDLCITSSSADSCYKNYETPSLDISVTNSPDLKISSRKSPDCNTRNLADFKISRESDIITRKNRSPDSYTFITEKAGLCQDFRESPDLVIKSSQPVSDTRTSRSPELDITVRNSPVLSIRSSKSPDVSVRTRKSPDISARTKKSPDLIVSAQKVSEINKNSVKLFDSFKQTRKSPDLLISTLNSPSIFTEHPNSYIVEKSSLCPISRVSPEEIGTNYSLPNATAKESPCLSGFEKRKLPDSKSDNFHCETIDDTKHASTDIELLPIHHPSTSKGIQLSESIPIWEVLNLNEKTSGECRDEKHEASSLSSLDTRFLIDEQTLKKLKPEKDPLNLAPVSVAPLPDVADVGRFSIKGFGMNVASPELGSPDDIETVRSVFEVSHHKTVDLEEQSENTNSGIVLKSELKIDPQVFLYSSVFPVDIRKEGRDYIQANAPTSPLFPPILNTNISESPKCPFSILPTNAGEAETDTSTKPLPFYDENIIDFMDSEGDNRDNALHLSKDVSKQLSDLEESMVTLTKFMASSDEYMDCTNVTDGKSSILDTKEVHEYVSSGTVVPKSSDIGTLSSTSAGCSYLPSYFTESTVVPDVSKPEGETRSSSFEHSEGVYELLTSVSPSLAGAEVPYNSSPGPVARRDLFPLEDDDEVTPHWHALMEVNAPDSEDDEPMCYDTDEDDFENMDAEMRRLEEKLKKFERELGGGVSSEGELVEEERKGAIESSSKLGVKTTSKDRNTSSIGLLRLRQEDIDVLRSFSLPEVYPPVDLLKTKHLSLLKNEVDILGDNVDVDEDVGPTRERQRTFSDSVNSNNLNIVKRRHRGKRGERKCRSLDGKQIGKQESGLSVTKLSPNTINNQIPVVVTEEPPSIVIEDSYGIGKKSEDISYIDDEPEEDSLLIEGREIDEEDETYGSYSLYSESHIDTDLTSSGHLVGEDLCDGVIWKEDPESEFSLFDCFGLESLLNHKRPVGEDYLFFIFEDDDDDDEDEFYSSSKENSSPHYVDGSFLLPVSTDGSYSARESPISHEDPIQEDIDQSCRKKRDISLVSAFKSSFRKAAKYLGPVPPSSSPRGKNLSNSPSCEVDGLSVKEKELDSSSMSGSYNVRTGQVQGSSLNDGDDTYGSGEFYASPALCILTSDEERGEIPSSIRMEDNLKIINTHDPSSLHQSSNRTPPPVPPRKSLLIQNAADHIEIIGRTEKPYHPPNQNLTPDPTLKQSSSPPTPTKFLRNLTKKTKNLVNEKSKEIIHGTIVPSGGRTDHLGRAEGNDKSLTSPHPKVLPEHRTWLTRGVSGACTKCVCLLCTSANSFNPFYLFGSTTSCPELLHSSINQPPEHCPGAKTNSGLCLGRETSFHASSVLQIYPPVSHESCTGTSLTSKSSPPPWSSSSSSSTSSSESESLWVPRTPANYVLYPFVSIFTDPYATNNASQYPSVNLFSHLATDDTNGVPACVKEAIPSFWNPIPPSGVSPSLFNSSFPSACRAQRSGGRSVINKLFHYSASESDIDS